MNNIIYTYTVINFTNYSSILTNLYNPGNKTDAKITV